MSSAPARTAGCCATIPIACPPSRAKPTMMFCAYAGWISNQESLKLAPREPGDKWEPYEVDRISRAIGHELRSELGPDLFERLGIKPGDDSFDYPD